MVFSVNIQTPVVGYFESGNEVSRRITVITPIRPAMKRAMRLALAGHSPLPRGAKKAAAIRARLKAIKNKFASSRIIYAALSASAVCKIPREESGLLRSTVVVHCPNTCTIIRLGFER
jgi:hypothetical protein